MSTAPTTRQVPAAPAENAALRAALAPTARRAPAQLRPSSPSAGAGCSRSSTFRSSSST